MTMDIRDTARQALQAEIDALDCRYGLFVTVYFGPGFRDPVTQFVAGIRVLEATPIFNRSTGAIEDWRYEMMYADMSILDITYSGHSVHGFNGMRIQKDRIRMTFRDTQTGRNYMLGCNDPHSLDEVQAEVYKTWEQVVAKAGGPDSVARTIDRLAAEDLETLRRLRGNE